MHSAKDPYASNPSPHLRLNPICDVPQATTFLVPVRCIALHRITTWPPPPSRTYNLLRLPPFYKGNTKNDEYEEEEEEEVGEEAFMTRQ